MPETSSLKSNEQVLHTYAGSASGLKALWYAILRVLLCKSMKPG